MVWKWAFDLLNETELSWIVDREVRDMLISLKDAYERFRLESHGARNSYDWYRMRAKHDGAVRFGDRRQLVRLGTSGAAVTKVNGKWMINEEDLQAEISEHRAAIAELDQITSDYLNGILHGSTGATLRTNFGSYSVFPGFHSIWRSDAKPWKETGVYWYCSICWKPATLAHNRPECHTCSDWGSCGRDCTLSEVSCEPCDTAMAV